MACPAACQEINNKWLLNLNELHTVGEHGSPDVTVLRQSRGRSVERGRHSTQTYKVNRPPASIHQGGRQQRVGRHKTCPNG